MSIESLIQVDANVWPVAVLVFIRVASAVSMLPLLGEQQIPAKIKILLSLLLAFVIWPTVYPSIMSKMMTVEWDKFLYFSFVIKELIFISAIAFVAKSITYALSMMGNIVGTGMGFQVGQFLNPSLEQHDSILSTWKVWCVVTLAFIVNLHHEFIRSLVLSFYKVPLGPLPSSSFMNLVISTLNLTFQTALRFGAPLILIQLMVNLSMGLLNKAVPQINVMVLNFPLTFLICFVLLFFTYSSLTRAIVNFGFTSEVNLFRAMFGIFR